MTSSNGNIFPCYWPFVRGIHRRPVNSQHKGQWRGALIFSLICGWINGWVNNREAGDLRLHRTHYDVIVMIVIYSRVGGISFACTFSISIMYIFCHQMFSECFPSVVGVITSLQWDKFCPFILRLATFLLGHNTNAVTIKHVNLSEQCKSATNRGPVSIYRRSFHLLGSSL